jgi:hypothetical protein
MMMMMMKVLWGSMDKGRKCGRVGKRDRLCLAVYCLLYRSWVQCNGYCTKRCRGRGMALSKEERNTERGSRRTDWEGLVWWVFFLLSISIDGDDGDQR